MLLNPAMWWRAIRVIPRLDKDEWNGLDLIARWLIATRAAVLIITVLSAAIAGLLAYRAGQFSWRLWLVLTLGLLMAHATNNLLNDLTDHLTGADTDDSFRSQYGPQPLEHGLMSRRENLCYALVTGLIAAGAGGYLVGVGGSGVLVLLAVGAFFVLFYSYPLKYFGLGELAVLVVWGPLMIAGGYYVLTGGWTWSVVLASLPYGLGATTVIFGKHIDKLSTDRAKRIHTLPVLIGERAARYAVIGMMAAQYGLVAYLVVSRFFSPVLLLVLLAARTFGLVIRVYRQPRPEHMPPEYRADIWPLWFVAFAFLHNRKFGGLFLLGLGLEAGLRQLAWLD